MGHKERNSIKKSEQSDIIWSIWFLTSCTHQMRIANFNTMSASNRQNDIPRTKNGRDKILDARYNASTQQQSYILAQRNVRDQTKLQMWGEVYSCWTMLWYTHENWRNDCGRRIRERELLYWCNVVDYEWFIIIVMFGHLPILLLFFPSLYPPKYINIEQLSHLCATKKSPI